MATSKSDNVSRHAWVFLRIGLGYIFLWAFFDKLFGLGFSTCKGQGISCSQAWLHGGSPTTGFLSHAATGPLSSFYHNLAGNMLVDWAFMLGLLFVGVGMLLGTWIKSAALVGMIMVALMWSALLWPVNAPGIDEHIIYFLAFFGFLCSNAGSAWSVKLPWLKLP
jgi:thiosulfate dehydrogenase [quinone] large subunit